MAVTDDMCIGRQ